MNESLDDAYAIALEEIAPGITAQADQVAIAGDSTVDKILRALPTVVMADTQRRLLNIQIDRAKKGLAPLDVSQYGMGVNVGLSPQTIQMLMFGGAALIAVYWFSRKNSRG